eukprot:366208-Chlamydomonas_euryale.AAC.10
MHAASNRSSAHDRNAKFGRRTPRAAASPALRRPGSAGASSGETPMTGSACAAGMRATTFRLRLHAHTQRACR